MNMDTSTPSLIGAGLIDASLINEFPILKQGHYVNHAAISPWPAATTQAVQAFAQENCDIGPIHYSKWLRREQELRKGLARMTNAESQHDIALLKNTTDCICTVAKGVHWQAGDNVVIPKGEFPSNRLPWLALQSQGVELREVDIRATDRPEQALLSNVDKRTRLLSVSAVQWTDGFRLELKTLGTACRADNILFFVDAIQILGALEIDVQACQIDFLAADAHKWLLGPEGIAVFYSRQEARDQLSLQQHGWHMTDDPYEFGREDWPPSAKASRFEAGSPNMLGQTGFNASVKLLLDHDMAKVSEAVMSNTVHLSEGLQAINGVRIITVFDPLRSAGMVCFDAPSKPLADLLDALIRKQVVCTIRGGGIRLSPHFYQAGTPIDGLLNVIEDVILIK